MDKILQKENLRETTGQTEMISKIAKEEMAVDLTSRGTQTTAEEAEDLPDHHTVLGLQVHLALQVLQTDLKLTTEMTRIREGKGF